jgi:hypothetical protein
MALINARQAQAKCMNQLLACACGPQLTQRLAEQLQCCPGITPCVAAAVLDKVRRRHAPQQAAAAALHDARVTVGWSHKEATTSDMPCNLYATSGFMACIRSHTHADSAAALPCICLVAALQLSTAPFLLPLGDDSFLQAAAAAASSSSSSSSSSSNNSAVTAPVPSALQQHCYWQ